MYAIKPFQIWVFGFALFAIVRSTVKGFSPDGWVIGAALTAISLQWCVVPYLLKEDMALLSYAHEILKRGRDDAVRLLIFLLGVFLYLSAMFVG